jgi:hypothetical protein
MTKVHKATRNNADQFISKRMNFKTGGALSGQNRNSGFAPSKGRLPEEYWESVNGADYIVYSYATPIAWWAEGKGWERPEVYYSNTTSHHQGKCPRTTAKRCGECGEFAPDYASKVHGSECSKFPGSAAWLTASLDADSYGECLGGH